MRVVLVLCMVFLYNNDLCIIMWEEEGEVFISGEMLRILHIHTKYLVTTKRKFSFLFLCGLSPSTINGDRLKISAKGSPRLIIHCLRPCQKRLDISQVQNRWMRVSLSLLQKVHCSLSLRFTLVRKVLVASLLCSSLNWKTINFVIFVHRKGVL